MPQQANNMKVSTLAVDDTDTDVYYTLAAKKPDSLIMGLENTIEQ